MLNGALPFFTLAECGVPLILVRSLSVAALFSAYGTLVFRAVVVPRCVQRLPADQRSAIDRMLRHLVWGSLAVDLLALAAWLIAEAGVLAEAGDPAGALAAVWPVATDTTFGYLLLAQLAAVPLVALALGRGGSEPRWRAAAMLSAAAVLLQAGHSHALAIAPGVSVLLVSQGLHLLSAGAWLGGLAPLLLTVRAAPPQAGAFACRWFSPLGKLCLYVLVATIAYQGWELLGGIPGLVGSAYGWMAMLKGVLFGILFGFAWLNRYRFAPALRHEAGGAAAKRLLIRSIAVQTGFGIAVVFAAGFLASYPPGLHTQPVWPFDTLPSLATVREDPAFRDEVAAAVLALAGAAGLVAVGIMLRRLRWPALAAAAVIVWFALPHLDLLLVPAYPTSFYRSPTGFAATSIAAGARLFPDHCANCHGAEGRGDGPGAQGLAVPPADLTAAHLWGHSDGELFWWLSHGIEAPRGGFAMPGFEPALSEDQRWQLIDYIRARNAGLVHLGTGGWLPPMRAPSFSAGCGNGRHVALDALRGQVVRIAFAAEAPPALLPGDVETVTVTVPPAGSALGASATSCVSKDPAIAVAYGILAGLPPDRLDGMQYLIDPNGWVRALRPLAEDGSRADAQALLDQIREICHHPIEDGQGGASGHHHHS